MILQALTEYYDRKRNELPPPGWIRQRLDFALVLDESGKLHQVQPLEESRGKERTRFHCLVPSIGKQALKHTNSGVDANLLWDNSGFALGQGKRGSGKLHSFIEAIEARLAGVDDVALSSVLSFLRAGESDPTTFNVATQHPDFGDDIRSGRPNVGFRLRGDSASFIFDRPEIRQRISQQAEIPGQAHDQRGCCLITGETNQAILLCHPVIKGVWGTQSAGATIVGINKDKQAFNSFGKEQGANSPVGARAVAAYTKALNHLLDSKQRLQVGDASTVFWSATESECRFEDFFGDLWKDDPDKNTDAVKSLFRSAQVGAFATDSDTTTFYVLGLSPNAARIAIRFWIVDTVANMAGRVRGHFEDIRIDHGPNEPQTLSLFRLLVSTATQGKADNIPPHLGGDTMRAILEGLPYPQSLLHAAIRRVRAEQSKKDKRTGKSMPNVTYERAAMIKACINRDTRRSNTNREEELTVSLDESNTNIGYRLGRLFAVLEKIQQDASPGINATIRDKFYGAASSTPSTVFGNLMRLSNHHLSKVENDKPGLAILRKKLLGAVMTGVDDFPNHLALADQGRFAIGYYHQTQKFFEKKAGATTNEETEQ